jgi:outer membrane lipoprotein carrier protein
MSRSSPIAPVLAVMALAAVMVWRPAHAQVPPASPAPQAGAVPAASALTAGGAVAKLQKALRAITTLRAKFEQLHYSLTVSQPIREKGDLFLRKPDRMRWEYNDPQDKVFLYKAGVLEMYLPEEKQLTRSPVPEETLKSDIFGLFLGVMSFEEAYAVEDSPFPTDASRVRQVKLTPKTEGDYSYLLLEIDEATWLPRRVLFFEWAGNKREFVFSQVRTGVRIPDRTFSLKVPPDTEVIDDTGNAIRQALNH